MAAGGADENSWSGTGDAVGVSSSIAGQAVEVARGACTPIEESGAWACKAVGGCGLAGGAGSGASEAAATT